MVIKYEEATDAMVSAEKTDEGFTPHAFGNLTLWTKIQPHVHLDQLEPNKAQPRHPERWASKALRNQILEAGGLFTPLLVEPTEEKVNGEPKYLVDDGHRRWTELWNILKDLDLRRENGELTDEEYKEKYERFAYVTVEVTHRPLTLEERVKVWLLIHRERREWVLQEREETAKQLIDLTSVRDAARFLGITESAAEKLANVFDIAQRIHLPADLQDRTGKDARITWARELRNLKADIRDDEEVFHAILKRIEGGKLRNSKDIRVLRHVWPEARDEILDVGKDLVRDIAQPRGVEDPVRATRGQRAVTIARDADFAASLNDMADAVNQFTIQQLQEIRGSGLSRKQAKSAIERMMTRLNELAELVD